MALLKTNTGIGTTNPTSALHVIGDGLFTGVVTATSFSGSANGTISAGVATFTDLTATRLSVLGVSTFNGAITGTISTATKLETARTFEITGDVVASPIAFDGTGNVSLAATIQPNSVELGTDTFGDYVESISGTANEIDVTGGTGEGSTPVISFAPNPLIGGNVTIGNDLQVNNNLNVTGNITVGGTAGYILVNEFRVTDADIILGFTTDISGNDVSNDTTANHGGIAVASTEGNPLVNLNIAGIETLPPTYKKIMWFKAGSFAGLNTDAWLSNYAIGIGSTQFPSGTRLAAGSVQFTENDLAVVRNINASGIVTAPTFVGNLTGTASTSSFATTAFTLNGVVERDLEVAYAQIAGISTNVIGGIASVTQLSVSGITTLSNVGVSQLNVSGVTTSVGGFVGNLTGTATTATNLSDAANITTGTINPSRLTGTYDISINGNATTSNYANVAGISTNVIGGIASVTQLSVSGVSTLGVVTAGNIFSTGIVTAPTFVGNLTGTASTASFATTAFTLNGIAEGNLSVGFATNLRGGVAGNVPYQSATDATTFVPNGSSGQVLLFNGSIPIWSNVSAASGAFGGITVYDEGNLVGTAASIASLNFVGSNLTVTGTSGANGIATVRMSDNLVGTALSISGISTFNNNVFVGSGITMYASTGIISATAFYGSGLNLTDLIIGKIEGLQIQNEGSNVGTGFTYATLNFVGDYVTATGVGTVANITFTTPPYALVSGIATYATTAGVSTNVIGGIASVTQLSVSGITTLGVTSATNLTAQQLNVSGVSTFSGITTSTSTLFANQLSVAGVSTFAGITTVTGTTLFARQLNVSGVSTIGNFRITPVGTGATVGGIGVTYYGDGSQLSGVSAGVSISTNTTNQNQLIPFAVSTGTTTGFGVTATGLVFNPSTTRLGIGTTNPLQNLHVAGNLLVAAGSATTQHITQRAYELEGGSLSWEGSAGQLFSITNNLTSGSIFSVNDVSGIPSIDVNADGTIQLAPYADGNVGIATTRPTSRLHVVGNALITGISTIANLRVTPVGTGATVGGIGVTYYGDGSQLTGTGIAISTNTTNQNQFLTYAVSTGSTTGLGVTSSGLVFNPSTTRLGIGTTSPIQTLQINSGTNILVVDTLGELGIGTTNPTSKLHVIGSALITGVSTIANLRVTPVGTGATVGGIGVTYYGDGSNLTGIQGGFAISTNTSNQAQYIPYATSFGSTTGAGATTLFVYNPSTTRLGIGTTNPQHNLHVIGDFAANTYLYSHISLGNISGITTINLNTATSFSATVTGITTFQFTNPTGLTASRSIDFVIQLTNGGSYAITFPTSVNWENGVTPTLTGVGTDLIGFFTNNTGTDWTGSLLLKDIR